MTGQMMLLPDDDLLPDALTEVSTALELPTPGHGPSIEDVRRFVVDRVTALLDRNPALLMSILYRVDVAESDVQRAFAEARPDALAGDLADLLIRRQIQKIRTRRRFASGG